MQRRAANAFVMIVLTLASASARAEPDVTEQPSEAALAEARTLFLEAVRAQDEARYRDALVLYQRVASVRASAKLLFNAATCHERLGELLAAEAMFERAAAEASKVGNTEVARESLARLDAVKKATPHVVVRLPPDIAKETVTATLDGAPVAAERLSDLRLDPGTHRLVVRDESRVREHAVVFELAAGAERVLDVELGAEREAAPSTPAPSAPATDLPPPKRSYVPIAIAGGAALAFAGGALVTGLIGNERRDRFQDLDAKPTAANRGEREDLRSSGNTMYVANAVLLGATAVAAAATIYLLFRSPARSRTTALSQPITF